MAEILWAPWRMTYIERPSTGKPGTDIFADLPAENDDTKNLILYRGEVAFVILNAYPYANGHLMIAPYRQIADITELHDDELLEINQLLAKGVRWIRAAINPEAFNIGVNMGRAAGAGIPNHIHWHIVPRWNGDTGFMSTIGDVRVIPEALDQTYAKLKRAVELES